MKQRLLILLMVICPFLAGSAMGQTLHSITPNIEGTNFETYIPVVNKSKVPLSSPEWGYANGDVKNIELDYTIKDREGFINVDATAVNSLQVRSDRTVDFKVTNCVSVAVAGTGNSGKYISFKITNESGEILETLSGTDNVLTFLYSTVELNPEKIYNVIVGATGTHAYFHQIRFEAPSAGPTKLTTPANVVAVPGAGEATFTWSPVDNATSYTLTLNNGVTPAVITDITESPYVASSLTNDTEYSYSLVAVGDGESYTNSDAATGSVTPSAAPVITLTSSSADATVEAITGSVSIAFSYVNVANTSDIQTAFYDDDTYTNTIATPVGLDFAVADGVITLSGTPSDNSEMDAYYKVSVVGGNEINGVITITKYSAPAPVITSPSNANQAVKSGSSIDNIVFTLENATGAFISGIEDLDGNYDSEANTYTVSGTPAASGTYTITAVANQYYEGEAVTATGAISVKNADAKNILVLGLNFLSNDKFMNSIEGNSAYIVDKRSAQANFSGNYDNYDLIVLHETLNGGDAATTTHELAKIKTVDKPILNQKSYFYTSGSSARWGWGTPNNGNSDKFVTIKNANHPIFERLSTVEGIINIYDNDMAKNIQPTTIENIGGYEIASVPGGVAIHDVPASIRLNGEGKSKYLMISLLSAQYGNLTDDALVLLNNAIEYLLDGEQFTPMVNGGSDSALVLSGTWDEDTFNSFFTDESKKAVTSIDLTAVVGLPATMPEGLNPNCLFYVSEGAALTGENVVTNGSADLISIADASPFNNIMSVDAASVQYSRTYAKGWYSICLPFACAVPAGIEVNEFDSAEGSVVNFVPVDELEANTPYIGYVTSETPVTFTSTKAVALPATADATAQEVKQGDYTFKGTFSRIDDGLVGSYLLNGDGSGFGIVADGSDAYVPAFRAYMVSGSGSGAKMLALGNGGGDVTDINVDELQSGMKIWSDGGSLEIYSDKAQSVLVYSIDGRVVSNLELNEGQNSFGGFAKGLYLINNSKVVIK